MAARSATQRRISADEVPTGTLGSLTPHAPRRIVDGLASQDVDIDQIVSMRLVDHAWSILVSTGPDANTDNERWSANPEGSEWASGRLCQEARRRLWLSRPRRRRRPGVMRPG